MLRLEGRKTQMKTWSSLFRWDFLQCRDYDCTDLFFFFTTVDIDIHSIWFKLHMSKQLTEFTIFSGLNLNHRIHLLRYNAINTLIFQSSPSSLNCVFIIADPNLLDHASLQPALWGIWLPALPAESVCCQPHYWLDGSCPVPVWAASPHSCRCPDGSGGRESFSSFKASAWETQIDSDITQKHTMTHD